MKISAKKAIDMSQPQSGREIDTGIYWVGSTDSNGGLHCNPYLLIDHDEGVLIDPGSVLDFATVFANVTSLIPLKNIKYVILHHQDPDFCASMPLFEQKGLQAKIVTHWRTAVLIKYYGTQSPYYIVNQNDFKLALTSGRTLLFVPTPYLHFPGAIATYDLQSKTLFSSDLFGAFSGKNRNLSAPPNYIEAMKAFHEHYMPGNEILRPVMEKFATMDISRIAPQHGCIIEQDIPRYIKVLRDLECGTFLQPIKRDLAKSGGYLGICNQIIKRLYAIYDNNEVRDLLTPEDIVFDDETGLIQDFNCTGAELWHKIFAVFYRQKGLDFLTIIEPLAQKTAKEYDIPLPEILQSKIFQGAKEITELNDKNRKLLEFNQELQESMTAIQENLTKCPITGLYNEAFFWDYLNITLSKTLSSALVLIRIDDIMELKLKYGLHTNYEMLKSLAYLLNNNKIDTQQVFKLNDPVFACCIANVTKAEAVQIAENIRNTVTDAEFFINKITVSIGVLQFEELSDRVQIADDFSNELYSIALNRLFIANNSGGNIVCSQSLPNDNQRLSKNILLVDNDDMNLEILTTALKNEGFHLFVAHDGLEALNLLETENIQLIIAELMLPKLDGLLLKDQLSQYSSKTQIPFILTSYQKDDAIVLRALALKVDYFLKKPYMLTEMVGIVKNKLKRG